MIESAKEFILVYKKYIIIFIILLFFSIPISLNFLQITKSIGSGIDSQQYIILGESIRSGQGYSLLSLPGNPPATQYPPLYPLIIAASLILTNTAYLPDVVIFLKTINFFLFFLALLVFYLYLREKKDNKKINLIILALVAVNPVFSLYINDVGTENLYLLLSIMAVYLLEKKISSEIDNKKYLYAGILFAILSFYARTIGISLIAAIIFYLFIKKQYKTAIKSSIVASLAIGPWFIWTTLAGDQPSYLKYIFIKDPYNIYAGNIDILSFFARIFSNILFYIRNIPEKVVLINLGISWYLYFPAIILLTLMIYGAWKANKKNFGILNIYIILYLFILLPWPFTENARFLVPILPFLIYFMVIGFERAYKKINKPPLSQLSVLVFLWTAIIIICYSIFIHFNRIDKSAHIKNKVIANQKLAAIANYADKGIPEKSIIIFRKPFFLYFYNRQHTAGYPYTNKLEFFNKAIEKYSPLPIYIIDDNSFKETKKYLQPVIEELINENKIELVHKSDMADFKVYKYR